MITNADITIFNKHYDPSTRLDTWSKTPIPGVHFKGKQAVNVGSNGIVAADIYTVRIPVNSFPTGKEYVDAEAYKATAKNDLSGLWTVQNGDIIAIGIVNNDTPKNLLCEHFTVTSVSDNRASSPALQHIRIEGK